MCCSFVQTVMFKYLKIVILICISIKVKAQLLYYQNTYKGGASFDGNTYYELTWANADTIHFQNYVPTGCTLKKAFLISLKFSCSAYNYPAYDKPISVLFNNTPILLDTSFNATRIFYSNSTPTFAQEWMCVKDITTLAKNSSNFLITPIQSYPGNECTEYYFYDGFYLLLLYENPSFTNVNMALYLNDMTNIPSMNYSLSNLNPVNTLKDVGLSIESVGTSVSPFLQFQLSSTTNTVTLGTLRDVSLNSAIIYKTGLGSFHYENGTLTGLVDDTNSPFIDSTDALCNINGYIPNNASSFSITATKGTNAANNENNETTAFILAYNTPCPATPNNIDSCKNYKLCVGQNVQLKATPGYASYNWFPTNGLSNANISNPNAHAVGTVNYICYVKDTSGCMHTEYAKIIVHPKPVPQKINTSLAICGSTQGILTITPNYYHYGYFYNLNGGTNQTDTVFNNLSSGQYTLNITDSMLCAYKTTFTIKDTNLAVSNFYPTLLTGCEPLGVYCKNYSNYFNNVTNSYTWYVNGDSATTPDLNYTFTDTGTFKITLFAYETLRSCGATSSRTITVKYCPPDSIKIEVPNVFTPNGDGINETWQLLVHNFNYTINNFQCSVYDRWGIKVFEADNISDEWNGKNRIGLACPSGSYYYLIKLTPSNSKGSIEEKDFKGFVELIK